MARLCRERRDSRRMRISTEPSDPGFANYNPDKKILVYLDGRLVPNAVMADEELGLVAYIEHYPLAPASIKECSGKVKICDAA